MFKRMAMCMCCDYEPAVSEVPKAMEYEGHKVVEVKRTNQSDWEIIIQKQNSF